MQNNVKQRRSIRWRAMGLVLPVLAVVMATGASAATTTSGALPFELNGCDGHWYKMYAPREQLDEAVPSRYEVYAGHTNGTPLEPMDEVANLAYGNLFVQTETCKDAEGETVTFSRVSVQVRQPSFDPGFPAQHPPEDKPAGTHRGYHYLLAFVVPAEQESATGTALRDYLRARGLPVFEGQVETLFTEMGPAPTGHATLRTQVKAGAFQYVIKGLATNAVMSPVHEHVESYYHDTAQQDGPTRTYRVVVDSLMVDWPAACTAQTESKKMAALMGGQLNAGQGWCFLNQGDVMVGASRLR